MEFAEKLTALCSDMEQNYDMAESAEIMVGETIDNSEIEGVRLDRDSVRSRFQNNLPIKNKL